MQIMFAFFFYNFIKIPPYNVFWNDIKINFNTLTVLKMTYFEVLCSFWVCVKSWKHIFLLY